MTFLVDAQLPPKLAQWIATRGHSATHADDQGLRHATDTSIWRHAESMGATIVTKDEDFALRSIGSPSGPPVVWLRCGNCTNAMLLGWFDTAFPEILRRLASGDRLIEVQ